MRVNINQIRGEIADQIFHTWNVLLPVASFNLILQDFHGNPTVLNGTDMIHKAFSFLRPA